MSFHGECTFGVVTDTTDIQLESLITFAAALGYEAVCDTKGFLIRFKSGRARSYGREILSVNTMIQAHNKLPGIALRELQDGPKMSFKELVGFEMGENMILALFAGYTKTVNKVKATHSKKNGFVVHCHKVEFMTRRDAAQNKNLIG